MKKKVLMASRLFCVLLLAVSLLMAAACGSSPETTKKSAESAPDQTREDVSHDSQAQHSDEASPAESSSEKPSETQTTEPTTEKTTEEETTTEEPTTEAPKTVLEHMVLHLDLERKKVDEPDSVQKNPSPFAPNGLDFQYDEKGRLVKISWEYNYENHCFTYSYKDDLLTAAEFMLGSHEDSMQCYGRNEYEYDESGHVIKIDHTGTNTVSPFRILYDGSLEFGLNNIGIASLPSSGSSSNPIYYLEDNAYTTEYEYDGSGRPTGYKNTRDGKVSAIHYSYDDETRTRKNISESGNTIPGQEPGYVFDEKGRVLSYFSFSFQKNETKNTYDEDGKISEILGLTYELGPDGNWSTEPVNGGTLTTYIYTYGDYTVE